MTLNVHIMFLHVAVAGSVEQGFRNALAPLGQRVTMRSVVAGQGSAAYEQYAADLTAKYGSVWAGLKETLGPSDGRTPDLWCLASWSAGYGAVRAMLRQGIPPDLACYCALDSVYGDLQGSAPSPSSVTPFAALAEVATLGLTTFAIGANDGAVPYASTSQMATAIAATVGLDLTYAAPEVREGHFIGRLYRAPHEAAVTGWGPALVAEAIGLAVGDGPLPPTPKPEPTPVPPVSSGGSNLAAAALGFVGGFAAASALMRS